MNAFICFFLVKITQPFPKVIMFGSSMGVLQTSFLFLTPKAYTCYLPRQSPQMWAHQFTRGTRTRRPGIYHSPTACFLTKQKAALIATHGHSHKLGTPLSIWAQSDAENLPHKLRAAIPSSSIHQRAKYQKVFTFHQEFLPFFLHEWWICCFFFY